MFIHIRFNILHTYLPQADTTGNQLDVFFYVASIVGFALSSHLILSIFLDVDSNVDVGTDDSEEGTYFHYKTTTRMHECSSKR